MRNGFFRLLVSLLAASVTGATLATEAVPSFDELEAKRVAFERWLASDSRGMEFRTESQQSDGGMETRIALNIDDIEVIKASETLSGPDAWCEILFLHLNVKACVYGQTGDRQWIRLYMGRKYYQAVEDTEMIELDFRSGVSDDGVSWVTLAADEGPYNTSDYRVALAAIEHGGGVYAELTSSQSAGSAINTAMDMYFATLARNKVGFSVIGSKWNGEPEYVGGAQGMLERNVVRYLLALRAYMQTHEMDGLQGMNQRLLLWFNATEAYARQLHEVERADYLRDKKREYQQQLRLQSGTR